jgi:RHS repeat-associated protein
MMANGLLGTSTNPGMCDTGTSAMTHSPAPGSLCGNRPSETQIAYYAMQAAQRLSVSMDWIDTRSAIGALLGDKSFTAGVVAGMIKSLATGIVELAWMLKIFALADYYDSQHSSGLLRPTTWGAPGVLMITMTASVFWPEFDAKARAAFDQREALIATVIYAFQHPGEVFDNIGKEQNKKFEEFKAYRARHTLSGEFRAGLLFGELLLDVLMILDGVTAIAKIAAKIPGLLKLLPRLQEMAPALRAAAKAGAEAGEAAGGAGKSAREAARAGAEAKRPAASGAKSERGSKGPAAKESPRASEEPQGKAKKDCACALAGKPVDAVAGCKALFGDGERDFALPAPLALAWQRTYSSDNPLAGLLGQGWSLPISLALEFSPSSITLQDGMHRGITFPLLRLGESFYSPHEQITLTRIDISEFELLDKDAVRNQFQLPNLGASVARLVGKVDRNGNRIGIEYDARQLPARITDSAGRTLVLGFDDSHRLTGVSEAAVPLVRYEFDAAGDLVRVLNQAGQIVREFAYRNHIMVRHAQPGGLVSDYEYSEYTAAGRVLRNTTNTGQSWQFVYAMGQTMVTDNLGRRQYYKFNRERRYTGKTDAMGGAERRQLDAFGNLTALTDANGSTERYQYDGRSRLTRIEAVDGAVTTIGYDLGCDKPAIITDALGASTRLRYDRADNLVAVTDPLGQRTEYRYDERGLAVELIDAHGGSKRMAYNAAGQLTAHTDCSGKATHFEYDGNGNLIHVTDALGHRSAYEYDRAGRLIAATHPDGGSETYDYDALGRLVGHTDAAGQQTSYALDAEGRLLARTNALGGTLEYRYDGARRLAQLVNENGAVYAFSYDALDRLVEEIGFDTLTTGYAYDKAGRPLAKTELGQTGVANGSGYGASIETGYRRDVAGRLLEKTVSGGTAQQRGSGPLSTRYRYDALGRLTEAANADATVKLAYDAIGQLVSEASHAHGASSTLRHAYDALGNRVQTILPDGRALNHLFYGSGHLHQINLDGEVVSDIERDAKHREISRTQGALTSQFGYDAVGRLTAQLARLDPARGRAGLAQQRDARQTADAAVAPVQGTLADNDSPIARQYWYDRIGNPVAIDDQRAGSTVYRYDAIGQILSAVQPRSAETFAFDPAHNLLDPAAVEAGGRLENNQLTMFEDKRYAYDAHGNLLDKKIGRHTAMLLAWNAAHQLIHSAVSRNADHAAPTVQRTEYGYDPFGRRVFKRDAFGETRFDWDGNRLLAETRGSHTRLYLYKGASFVPLAQVNSVATAPATAAAPSPDRGPGRANVCYFHNDHLGTPRELTDTEGNVQWTATYQAWGNVVQVEWSPAPAAGQAESCPFEQTQALRFQGQYFDSETGLHYNRFRYYDPDIGRFVSQDPIGLAGGTNVYQYAPNPCGWLDPLGLAGNPATATHITYLGMDSATGKPYVGYASMQGSQAEIDVLKYRYSGDYGRFGGNAPEILYRGFGQEGKDTARGLEQRHFEAFGGLEGTANTQNPVGIKNARRDEYLAAADNHIASTSCKC